MFGAPPAHEPERPPEPRLSGVHLEEAAWDNGAQLRVSDVLKGRMGNAAY
jgi:hypothetical protein